MAKNKTISFRVEESEDKTQEIMDLVKDIHVGNLSDTAVNRTAWKLGQQAMLRKYRSLAKAAE